MAETLDKGHGRVEKRRLQASTRLAEELDWPGLAQVCRVTRTRQVKGQESQETAYAISSLPREQAGASQLLGWLRGHWGIENRLHWVRDVTFDEDRSRLRTGSGPQVMAAFRNAAIGYLRQLGWTNIAAGIRHFTHRPRELLTNLRILE